MPTGPMEEDTSHGGEGVVRSLEFSDINQKEKEILWAANESRR